MAKHLTFLGSAALSILLALPAQSDDSPNADTVVATVNDKEVTLGQMIALKDNLPPQYQSLPPEVLFDGLLDQLIQQILLADSYKGEVPKRISLALEIQRLALVSNEIIGEALTERVTDEAVQAAYDARYADFEGSQEFNASHILVETQEEAQAIADDIRGGADFAETAREKSTGPSGPNGGELGWFGPGQMVEPFETAVGELDVGGISDPVQTQFGWHVIILNDSRLQPAPALETVRAQLEEEIGRAVIDEIVADLENDAAVDRSAAEAIDPTMLNQSDLLEN